MYAGSYSARTVLQDFALRVPVEWFVRILLLTSMKLQLVLVVLGARRYLSSSGILRFMVWLAYISADAVAIFALGIMMNNDRRQIYGIWAPVLLMHLGGPDAITAYAMADNELWLRHGFNMVYQVSIAVYVIYASSLKGYPLAAAILLLLVGSIKYAERILALRYGNCLRIVMSNLSISKYMEIRSVAEKWKYVVMGEEIIEQEEAWASRKGKGVQEELEMPSVKEELARPSLKGRGIQKERETSSLKGKEIVTSEDVAVRFAEDRGYDLCLSHALFKMYKGRFGSSYSVQGDQPAQTRDFSDMVSGEKAFEFVEADMYKGRFGSSYSVEGEQPAQTRDFSDMLGGEKAFEFAEMELKFVYDAMFSKYSSPGFAKWRMFLRFLNTIFLGAAGYLILGEGESRQAQRTVTYIVISAALVVEVFQIWRVIMSDWTRVHLICAYVAGSRNRESDIVKWCILKVIEFTLVVQDFVGFLSKVVGGNRYWSNQIPQHCLIETWLNTSPPMCKISGRFPKPDSFIVSWYAKIRHVHNVPVENVLKVFILEILNEAGYQEYTTEECRQNVYNFEKNLFGKKTAIVEVLKSHGNLEEAILIWHIATTLCDTQIEVPRQNEIKNVRISRILSRYCAYLLLSRPNLLPLRPEMARIVYMQLLNQLLHTVTLGSILEKYPGDLFGCKYDLLGSGAKLAELLLKEGEEERWELLAKYWGKLVIYMAVYNKAIFHAECVAAGGEFLSLVWVLLGHMGRGEQSDKDLAVAESTGQDSAAMVRTSSDCEKELDEVQKKLSDREKELDAMKKKISDLEEKLAPTNKFSRDDEIQLTETN